MRVVIRSIADRGDPEKERIVMVARKAVNIGDYAILEAGYDAGSVNTYTRDSFWFPDKDVDEGDYVVLYTKIGNDKEKVLKSGKRSHFFYWHEEKSKWGSDKMAPVLLQVEQWSAFVPEDT